MELSNWKLSDVWTCLFTMINRRNEVIVIVSHIRSWTTNRRRLEVSINCTSNYIRKFEMMSENKSLGRGKNAPWRGHLNCMQTRHPRIGSSREHAAILHFLPIFRDRLKQSRWTKLIKSKKRLTPYNSRKAFLRPKSTKARTQIRKHPNLKNNK